MTLDDLSAAVVAFSLLLYVMLDGTDLGVGIILPWFDDDDDRRRLVQSLFWPHFFPLFSLKRVKMRPKKRFM